MRNNIGARWSPGLVVNSATGNATSSCPSIPTVGGVEFEERTTGACAKPKHQVPSTKHQTNTKRKAPGAVVGDVSVCSSELLWSLELGAGSFITSLLSPCCRGGANSHAIAAGNVV